jgi:hypothetical protein
VGSRFIIQGHRIFNARDEARLTQELREVCHNSHFNVSVFHPYFIYYDQVRIRYISRF